MHGMHALTQSKSPIRARALKQLRNWLDGKPRPIGAGPIRVCNFLLLALMLSASTVQAADGGDLRQTLSTLAEGWRTNTRLLDTWSGEVELSYARRLDADLRMDVVATIDFAYDRKAGQYRSTALDGRDRVTGETFVHAEMKTPDRFFTHNDLSGQPILLIQHVEAASPGSGARAFVPGDLVFHNISVPPDVYLENLTQLTELEQVIHVEQNNEMIVVRIETEVVRQRLVFDAAKDGVLVRSQSTHDHGTWDWQADYEHINGVWVPTSIDQETALSHGGAETRTNRHVQVRTRSVNERLPPDAFDVRRLEVQDGDLVNDMVINQVYRYGGNESARQLDGSQHEVGTQFGTRSPAQLPGTEVDSAEGGRSPATSSDRNTHWLLSSPALTVVGIAVSAAVVGWWLLRMRERRNVL